MTKLYAFGSNGCGQLGIGNENDTANPEQCLITSYSTERGIKQVAAGGNHTLVLGENYHVEAFGSNAAGQCGTSRELEEERDHVAVPFCLKGVVPLDERSLSITQISATWTASICLDNNGKLHVAGQDLSDEHVEEDVRVGRTTWTIPNFPPHGTIVRQISSSVTHTVAVLSNGEVWGWGKGRKGQLGQPAEDIRSPRKLEGLEFPVIKAACGKDFTCVVGEKIGGQIALIGACGKDRFGVKSNVPKEVPHWKDVTASWGSVYVLFEDGRILAWGRDDHGQLPPPGLPPIEALAAGSEHCIALTKAGKVLAWGWGEHGNCGERTDHNGDVKGRWNEINLNGSVKAVFAGCATSFIVTNNQVD
ncbi:hypothetical protein M433DRAFT_149217 [Acidomyces richmondensis BFW]|nr:MAG: hypothetical protein FE78DRAFT_84429 [Acidomyces sp. 'richmondensis']KYG50194.1 hypothetical protein M433DRAFT_149217 [Acidomyces richmondensis BFW]